MSRYRIMYGENEQYGVEKSDDGYNWGELYEADNDFPTAHLMVEILNETPFDELDWKELRARMEERGWKGNHA